MQLSVQWGIYCFLQHQGGPDPGVSLYSTMGPRGAGFLPRGDFAQYYGTPGPGPRGAGFLPRGK